MINKKSKYNKIENNNLVPNSVLGKAMEEMEKKDSTKILKKRNTYKWSLICSSVAIILIAIIVLPIMINGNNGANLNNGEYSLNQLTKYTISSFIEYNQINGTEYKQFNKKPSSYYEYKHKKKTVLLSQIVDYDNKKISLWIMNDNIAVTDFNDYNNLKNSDNLQEYLYNYEINNTQVKVKLNYLGWQYLMLFEGHSIDEVKSLMIELIE